MAEGPAPEMALGAGVRRHRRRAAQGRAAVPDGLARAQDDLERAVRDDAVRPLADTRAIRTTDHRVVPLLALLLDRRTDTITAIDWGPPDAPLMFAYTDRTWTVYLRDLGSASTRNFTERELERRPAASRAVTVSR